MANAFAGNFLASGLPFSERLLLPPSCNICIKTFRPYRRIVDLSEVIPSNQPEKIDLVWTDVGIVKIDPSNFPDQVSCWPTAQTDAFIVTATVVSDMLPRDFDTARPAICDDERRCFAT